MISKYKTVHILLTNVHLDGSSNRNTSRDESVETGDEFVEAGDESVEAGEKTQQSCYNECLKIHDNGELRFCVVFIMWSSISLILMCHAALANYGIYADVSLPEPMLIKVFDAI